MQVKFQKFFRLLRAVASSSTQSSPPPLTAKSNRGDRHSSRPIHQNHHISKAAPPPSTINFQLLKFFINYIISQCVFQSKERTVLRRIMPKVHAWRSGWKTFCTDSSGELHGSHNDQATTVTSMLLDKQDSTNNIPQYDVAIVGGGMVGRALACSSANMPLTKHLNVAIIDSNPALTSKECIKNEDPPDPRVSTVKPATISFFKGVQRSLQFQNSEFLLELKSQLQQEFKLIL